jgi:hypothetical protein
MGEEVEYGKRIEGFGIFALPAEACVGLCMEAKEGIWDLKRTT